MSENIISTLKEELSSFFGNIGLTIEFTNDDLGEKLFTFNIGKVFCIANYNLEDAFLAIGMNSIEEWFCFSFDASLPSGKKLQPMYSQICGDGGYQIVFFVGPCSFEPSQNLSFENYTFLVVDDYTYLEVNRSERGNELHPKKGEILLHEVRDDKDFEFQSNYTQFVTNRIVPDLQFKSIIPEIQAWIEKQVA